VTTVPVPVPGFTLARRRISATLTSAAAWAGATARRGGATAIGAAGLASTAVGAGAQWGWPVGLMVAGPLAVWFASLLPGGQG
jgi:hypothetical protein